MIRLSVRLTLAFLCLAAAAATAFLLWSMIREANARDADAGRFAASARSASLGIVELRAAQQAYVAAGQGPDFWFARVSAIVKETQETLAALKPLAESPAATLALDEASGALQDFEQMDRRARDYTRTHQLTLASDLIFADGFDLSAKAGQAIQRALTAELTDRDSVLGFLRRRQAYTLAGGSSVFLIVLALLVPLQRPPASQTATAAAAVPPPVSQETLDDLHDFGTIGAPGAAAPKTTVDLPQVASLCADFARISETRALPALLARAAGVLDASGIVIWIADPDGRELAPILVHGYPPQLATRLGTLARDAENLTASAYRTGLLQTVKADTVSSGAIAAPLVSAAGCVGVMAAELDHGGESKEPVLAAATIIASQLATLVGPPASRSAKVEAG